MIQTFKNKTVQVMKNQDGVKFLKINSFQIIPVALAMSASGRDAWMRDVLVKCSCCKKHHPLKCFETETTCINCIENDAELSN